MGVRSREKRGTLYPLRKHTKGPHKSTLSHCSQTKRQHARATAESIVLHVREARSESSHLGTERMSLLWAGPSLRDRCRSASKKLSGVRWPLGACDPAHNKAYRHGVITITHTSRTLAHTRIQSIQRVDANR